MKVTTKDNYLASVPEIDKAAQDLLNRIIKRTEEREGRTPTPDELEGKAIEIIKGHRRD